MGRCVDLGQAGSDRVTGGQVFELAARCERAARHHDVLRHDLSYELHQRDVGELGGAPHTILADWLRVTQQYLKRREGP